MANNKNFIAKNGVSTGDGYSMPDIRPSLLLDFANSKTLDPRITFTRGSTATYWDGKTTTKAEENLARYTDDFTTIYTFEQVTVTRTDTAPDGTASAVRMTETTANTDHRVYDTISYPAGTNTTSVYAKYVDRQYLQLRMLGGDSGTYAGAVFDIQNGTVPSTSNVVSTSITSVGNGWYRLSVTADADSNGGSGNTVIAMTNSSTYSDNAIYTGTGAEVLIWGLQVENRSSATAYTPTTSSPIVKYQPTLQTAASGAARFDHDPVTGESKGLLIEEARTNLILCSRPEDTDTFGSNGWQDYYGFRAYRNTVIAPDGTQTAATVRAIVGGATTGASMYVNNPIVIPSDATYTYSVYLKKGGERPIDLVTVSVFGNGNAAGSYQLEVDLSDGTVDNIQSGTAIIEDVGNGWYRCSVIQTLSAGNKYPQVGSYGSAALGSTFLMWGAQLELGGFTTSFIATSGSTVTRSSDRANMSLSGVYSSGPVSMYVEAAEAGDVDYARLVLLSDGTNDNRMQITISESSGVVQAYVETNDVEQTSLNRSFDPPYKTFFKAAAAFDRDNVAVTADGLSVVTDTSVITPQVTNLYLGSLNDADADSGATFKKVALYPSRLSNATLQAMTEE